MGEAVKIDDIALDIVTRNSSYVSALSTVGVPLVALTAKQVYTRNYEAPYGDVCVYLEALPEEFEEIAPSYSIATMKVECTVFCSGNTEAVLREQAANYAKAIVNCLRAGNPYFFAMVARDDFDGVEGKEDIKATKVTLEFRYEED
jgi:hypothetical protein